MFTFIIVRLVQAIPALLGVTIVAFTMLQLSGDMTQMLLPTQTSDEDRAAFRRAYGLDQPLPVQYLTYLGKLVQGDFGRSFAENRPAIEVVMRRIPATLELTVAALVISLCLSIPAGVLSAVKRNTPFDHLTTGLVLLGQAIPTFWLGMLMILLFAVTLQVLPVSGRGTWQQLVLPAFTLAIWLSALMARLVRSGMLEAMTQDYVRTARAKGLDERAVAIRHALRNILIPIVTVFGLQIGGLLGGAVMTETIFAWPGVGTLVLDSILKRDYPVVLTALILIAVGFVLINLLIDLTYGYLDPRVRTRGAK